MTRAGIPGLVCLCVLCGILTLGLWPFRRPLNEVSWSQDGNGVRIGHFGTLWSAGSFPMDAREDEASCSLEIWLQPGAVSGSNTLLAFSTPENPLQLSLHQYQSQLILKRQSAGAQHQTKVIGIEGVFRQIKPTFITVTSSSQQTSMYVNGALARRFPRFRLCQDFSGRLVIGTSPVYLEGWPGQLKGLAIYHVELAPQQVAEHYETWTTHGAPKRLGNEGIAALYLFDEHSGNIVHNAILPGIDLYIPKRFSLLHETFLEPFWKEYSPGRDYLQDILINIVGFIPLGFCFYAYWTLVRPIRSAAFKTVLFGLAVSLTIEVLQSYLPTRSSGTTDLMTNTLGTFLGVRICGLEAVRNISSKVEAVLKRV
jgi:VanZ family protein